MKVAFIFLPPWDPKYPSYALALFHGSTKKAGHEFIGFDLNVDLYGAAHGEDKQLWEAQVANRWSADHDAIVSKYSGFLDSYVKKMMRSEADLYAMSINVYSKPLAFYLAQKIKEKNAAARILFGGPQCFPAYDGLHILSSKYVDAICTGEGDVLWPKILDHYEKNRNLQFNVPGLSYKDDAGNIIDNGVPDLVRDLNAIPFADYSAVDFKKYGNKFHFSIMTSRGCINTCAFCSERPNFSKYRTRSADNVYGEIVKHLDDMQAGPLSDAARNAISYIGFNESLVNIVKRLDVLLANPLSAAARKAIPYISFNDSLINGVPSELERFCDLVIKGGRKFLWGGMALIRKEMTYELLSKMKQAGCYNLAWGMESGCQEVLELMHKRFFDMTLAKKVIKTLHEVGIQQSISLITGFPGETEEMFNKTKEFVAEYKDYFSVGVQPMMLSKNSEVHDKLEEFGIKPGSDWLKWQSIDGTNTYEIRLRRVEILRSVLDGEVKTIDK